MAIDQNEHQKSKISNRYKVPGIMINIKIFQLSCFYKILNAKFDPQENIERTIILVKRRNILLE